jgi:hypothetical protein
LPLASPANILDQVPSPRPIQPLSGLSCENYQFIWQVYVFP